MRNKQKVLTPYAVNTKARNGAKIIFMGRVVGFDLDEAIGMMILIWNLPSEYEVRNMADGSIRITWPNSDKPTGYQWRLFPLKRLARPMGASK